jgi:WD40 repeat protein
VAFSPDGATLAVCTDADIQLWNLSKKKLTASFVGHDTYMYSLAFSPDRKELVSGGLDKTVKLWDVSRILKP